MKLPDGRVQTVTYYVDPYSGYQAKVIYKGEATPYAYKPYTPYEAVKHPAYKSIPASPSKPLPDQSQYSYNQPYVKELARTIATTPAPFYHAASPSTSISLVTPAPPTYASPNSLPRYRYFDIELEKRIR